MAVIKLRSSSNANRLINYCERKAEERDGVNCDPEYVREQMKWTREEWEKTDGVQAHHVIQSFNPEDNITAREANELGRRLAEQIAPGHEVAVYTHTDREHIHNHLVINSVSFEDGHKYHSDKEQLYNIREKSDELCREKGLDIIREPYAQERFSQAEYKLVERGERLWKDELRTAIDDAKQHTKSLDDMKSYLKDRYNIEMKIQNQNVSFLHPEKEKYVRGKTLGESYTKGAIEHEHGRQREAQLQPVTEVLEPTESYLEEISEHLRKIRSFQEVLETRFDKVSGKTDKVIEQLSESEAERKKLLTDVKHLLIGMDKKAQEQNQRLATLVTKKEQELENALKEVRQLKVDLVNGFMNISQKSKVPLSHTLYKLGTIAGSSVLGGLIIFLVLKVITKS
ncbi:relaxase/mobilization nuclease domain-containing protein [Alicyclobacillus fastidiosus]|uniref:relaxase/mobilization nuclease domain-containing protein n=1 Tax=Alicyclobacillus fastidiosus TaxID=392011 RepID=UPI0024E0A531|nr:relaxase/mobilization nuclease domain-containing protein [Alicyclobacillus fastidiosus]